MQKPFSSVPTLLATGVMLIGSAVAQTPGTPAQPTTPAKTPSSSATKTTHTPARAAAPLALKTQKDKFSYALGMNIGTNLHRQNIPVDPAIMARALRDALTGAKPALTEEEAKAVLTQMQNDMRQKQQEKMQAASVENKKIGDAFLATNKTAPGVVTTASGLQYKVIQQGTGPKPTAADTVVCNYKGTLINGKEFDSSYKRGQPATFPVSGVIKGWTEALQLMPVGSKYQLFIPSDLAYGDRAPSPDIEPGSTLIFEVELLSIQPKTDSKSDDKSGDQSKQPGAATGAGQSAPKQ
jgi:FKBP-type peptidyl-prolyl cis-trans isomerase FklB